MYRAVGSRVALDLRDVAFIADASTVMDRLLRLGFRVLDVDLVREARSFVGRSRYRRGARLSEAPHVFDCSSFVKWIYGRRGVWIPRRTIQQLGQGEPAEVVQAIAGDLLFTTGHINYFLADPRQGVGHVGMATGEGTVIHAASRRVGILESDAASFLENKELRGVRRHIPRDARVITLEVPEELEVESSDDVKWILLSR